MSLPPIKVIGFDADDTLWVNEPYFQDIEKQFSQPSSRITVRRSMFIGNSCPACICEILMVARANKISCGE